MNVKQQRVLRLLWQWKEVFGLSDANIKDLSFIIYKEFFNKKAIRK